MRPRTLLATGAYLFMACVAVKLAAQGAPQTPPAPAGAQTAGDSAGPRPRDGHVPRAAAPARRSRAHRAGPGLYGVYCRACHGADLRGGDMGGPNLLRSQLVAERSGTAS